MTEQTTGAVWDGLHQRFGYEATMGGDQQWTPESYRQSGADTLRLLEQVAGDLSECAVLDYGCGDGRVAEQMVLRCRTLVCADASELAIKRLMVRVPNGIRHVYQTSRMARIPLASFDLIYAWNVAFHLTNVQILALIHDGAARLNPGGRLVFNYCNIYHPRYLPVLRHAAQQETWHAGPFPHTPTDGRPLCYFALSVAGFRQATIVGARGPNDCLLETMQPVIVCQR